MPRRLAAAACVLFVTVAALAQERAKKDEPANFKAHVSAAQAAWDAGRFGACLDELGAATSLAVVERIKHVRAALPAAPAGYAIEVDEGADEALKNPMVGALALSVGSVVTQRYKPTAGGRPIQVTVTFGSPMLQMLQAWIANPAMLPKGSELVKYGPHNAVLKVEQGKGRNLQILVVGNLVEVQWPSEDEEALFAMFDQKAVDALQKALAN